jgi:folate-binding protein YgfZ
MNNLLQQYEAACARGVAFDLNSLAKVELAGPEARSFLHNLCTSDVKDFAEGAGCEAFLTTAKARVVAHVLVGYIRRDQEPVLLLDTVPGQGDVLTRHLNHYLVSEQVEIADRTADWALHRFVGPAARAHLESMAPCDLSVLKHLQYQAVRFPGDTTAFVRRFDGLSLPAWDVFCPSHAPLWTASADWPLADPQVHEILRVEGGWPAFGVDIDENRLVMEVGRTAQAISYSKGCFLGQEPIVMARDRGQVNRMLMGVTVATGEPLPKGARLFQGESDVGQVTSSVHSPRLGRVIALVYLKRGSQQPGLELAVEPATDGRRAVVTALPFLPPTASAVVEN